MNKHHAPPVHKLLPAPRSSSHRRLEIFTSFLHRIPGLRIVYWGTLGVLVISNILFTQPKVTDVIFRHIQYVSSHEGPLQPAARFLHQFSTPTTVSMIQREYNVLGATTEKKDVTQTRRYNTAQESYVFWKSVVTDHPEYRDAYVQLTLLAYQLHRFDDARSYITAISLIDPNYPALGKLRSLLPR